MAAVGPGPPDSAPVLVTTMLWPSIRTTELGVFGGSAKALSPRSTRVSAGVAAIASGLSRSSAGATVGCDGRPRSLITCALRVSAWSKRVGSLRTAADTSRSPKGRVSTDWERAMVRKRWSHASAAAATAAAASSGSSGSSPDPDGGGGVRLPVAPSVVAPSVGVSVGLGSWPGTSRSGSMLRAGLPWASRTRATSTAGSTSQLYGAPSAASAMSSTPSRLPPSSSRRCHRSTPPMRPASSYQTGLRIERMTEASCVPPPVGSFGMKVRARPSATASRGTELSPSAWMPIQ